MSGVVVVAELEGDRVRPRTRELITAARSLSSDGAGPVAVLLLASEPERLADEVDVEGVEEIVLVHSPLPYFEAHVTQAALAAVVGERAPAVVLAAHAVESFAFAPALAAAGGLGLATDVTELRFTRRGPVASRGAFAERLVYELEFRHGRTVVVLLRVGTFEAGGGRGAARRTSMDIDLTACARTQRIELREPTPAEVDITTAPFLLAVGRGVDTAERLRELEVLADRIGATICVTRPMVDAGLATRSRQVGQSGRTVAPRVYLALGVSGAAQHVAGMSGAKTIIAVNSDPHAPIFRVAHYGAVADLFEVADELRTQLGEGPDDGLR